jgi:hypothetical protein
MRTRRSLVRVPIAVESDRARRLITLRHLTEAEQRVEAQLRAVEEAQRALDVAFRSPNPPIEGMAS